MTLEDFFVPEVGEMSRHIHVLTALHGSGSILDVDYIANFSDWRQESGVLVEHRSLDLHTLTIWLLLFSAFFAVQEILLYLIDTCDGYISHVITTAQYKTLLSLSNFYTPR